MTADASLIERRCADILRAAGVTGAVAVQPVDSSEPELDALSEAERARLGTIRLPKRRSDWVAGRAAAKRAALALLGPGIGVERVHCTVSAGGAPRLALGDRVLPDVALTIAHSGGIAGAIAARRAAVGLDLELIAQVEPSFVAPTLTQEERASLADLPSAREATVRALRLWTAKEAVLKALRVGLRWPLASVEVDLDAGRALAGGARFSIDGIVTREYVTTIALGGG